VYASVGESGTVRSLARLSAAYLGAEAIGCDYLIGMLRAIGLLHLPRYHDHDDGSDRLYAWEVGLIDTRYNFDLLLLLGLEIANRSFIFA